MNQKFIISNSINILSQIQNEFKFMKNPFLEDRNIFSKVPKPITKIAKDDKETENLADKKSFYEPKYSVKAEMKTMNPLPNNQPLSTYQRQASSNFTSTQPHLPINNRYMSSQKITFGDPMSSEAYTGDRTSGYFNMLNSQQQNSTKPIPQSRYDNLKYEPRKNNFFEPQNKGKQVFSTDMNMKETRKDFGKGYGNYNNRADQPKMDYEFAPPPINNFTTTQPMEHKSQFQTGNYTNKPSFANNQQRPSHQSNPQNLYIQTSIKNDSNFMNKNTSNTYKSPPKYDENPLTPKNDISQRFKENNYAQFSPIGEVSRHKINEDSIMNLDGLMDGIELDKLLAESKTQEELLKILGMDTSMKKKNPNSGGKKQVEYEQKFSTNQAKPENNSYAYNYGNQPQNNFSKKSYEVERMNQVDKFHRFKDEDEEPQVFNYGESSLKNLIQQKRSIHDQRPIHSESNQNFNNPSKNSFRQPESNFYNQIQTPFQKSSKQNIPAKSQEEQYDLEKIIQKQMENFMIQQEGSSHDRRVFMTANQKIITKKYKLQAL